MSDKAKIAAIYGGVAVICAAIISMVAFTRGGINRNREIIVNSGKPTEAPVMTTLTEGQTVINQDGTEMDLMDLKGKVWVFVQFFAACPQCAKRNLRDLKDIVERYQDNPDFRMVCVTVDPKRDTVDKLKTYADGLGADSSRWLFLTGDPETLMPYMVQQMKYPTVEERKDPTKIAELGLIKHDLALAVFDRDLQMRGKHALFGLKDTNPELYEEQNSALNTKIRTFLAQ